MSACVIDPCLCHIINRVHRPCWRWHKARLSFYSAHAKHAKYRPSYRPICQPHYIALFVCAWLWQSRTRNHNWPSRVTARNLQVPELARADFSIPLACFTYTKSQAKQATPIARFCTMAVPQAGDPGGSSCNRGMRHHGFLVPPAGC